MIALGKVADEWCRMNVGHVQTWTRVTHPQAWKRFHYHQTYPLAGIISDHITISRRAA